MPSTLATSFKRDLQFLQEIASLVLARVFGNKDPERVSPEDAEALRNHARMLRSTAVLLEGLAGTEPPVSLQPPVIKQAPSPRGNRGPKPGTILNRVLAILRAQPGEPLFTVDIQDRLNADGGSPVTGSTLRAILCQSAHKGLVYPHTPGGPGRRARWILPEGSGR